MRKKWYITLSVLVVLITVLMVLVNIRDKSVDRDIDFTIRYDGMSYHLSDYDLETMEQVDLSVFGDESFRGYPFPRVVSSVGLNWDEIAEIYLSSIDGSRIRVSPQEALQGNVILISFQTKPLRMRVVFPQDEFRNRWLKDIYLMELF